MDMHKNMSGRYWQTCSKEITASPGWLKRVMTLGLLNLVPIFGQIVILGYAYEWAHKIAWGVREPLPTKIFSRPQSKMLRWGVYAFVITLLFTLVPQILFSLGDAVTVSTTSSFWQHTAGTGAVTVIRNVIGLVIQLAGLAALIFAVLLLGPALMRMVAYDDVTAGLQLREDWKMFTHDAGGILRIVGMTLLLYCIAALLALVVVIVLACICIFAAVLPFAATSMLGSDMSGASGLSGLAGMLGMIGLGALPLVLALMWVFSCFAAWMSLLVARAYGYWTAQFDLASWGAKDEPMPFERVEHQDAYDEFSSYAEAQTPDE